MQPPPGGTKFSITIFPPNTKGVMHNTRTIDYCIVMSGQIDLDFDDGSTTTLRAGDVIVQLATNHAWSNRGAEPTKIAFVMIDVRTAETG